MKKIIRRLIGIRRLKREGLRYLKIAEKIREFKVGEPIPRSLTFPVDQLVLIDEDIPMVKIPKWKQWLTRVKMWFERLFIKIKSKFQYKAGR